MNNKLSSNQIAYLNRAMTDGKGLIEIGELARGLGKQKGNIIRKLESNFPPEQLFKMKTVRLFQMGAMVLHVRSKPTCSTIRQPEHWR